MEIDQQRLHPDAAFCRAGKDSARQSLDETLQYVAELVLLTAGFMTHSDFGCC